MTTDDELRESVPDSVTAEWEEEILRRAEAFERGELKTVDGNAVFDRIEKRCSSSTRSQTV